MKVKDLSLCMIVKNSEKTIRDCLEQAIKYFEDIVIVDTGSTDNTIRIVKEYTDRVFEYKWNDDFSAARNYSISLALNNWVFILDSDEIIINFDVEGMKKFLSDNIDTPVVGRIKRINVFETEGAYFYSKYTEWINRIFSKEYFLYRGIIHEQIVCKKNGQTDCFQTRKVDVTVKHEGYKKEILYSANKIERNIKLLTKAILQSPEDEYLLYQLGKSFFIKRDYESAKENFEKALKRVRNFYYEFVEDLIISYGYSLLNLGDYRKALELESYEKYYLNSADFNFLLGLIYMNNAMFDRAIERFKICMNLKEAKVEGTNSFLAAYNIGVICEVLGFKDVAKEYYLRCGNFPLALERLKNLS